MRLPVVHRVRGAAVAVVVGRRGSGIVVSRGHVAEL